ncbi:MAG: hypothetical protein R3Y61_01200 [Rikenellaceae bacterium]
MRLKTILFICVALFTMVQSAMCQFYDNGRGRTSTKWKQLDSTYYKIVYPEGYLPRASGLAYLLDSISGDIGYGVGVTPRKVPIILRTDNLYSNGFVVWAPKREELVMTAPLDTYAITWDKHLSVHEWRHVTQITSLKHGITKAATWLLGEAGMSVGLAVIPDWILEGDAVVAETQFTEFGRGVQPEFTVEYRAMFADNEINLNHLDRWICGSYKKHYPDIYKFGYQTLSAAQTYLGADYFGEMMKYSGTWPIFIIPTDLYLWRKHKTTYNRIAKRAFGELDSLWQPYSEVTENFSHITDENKRSYTTYLYPQSHDDRVIALKSDYDTPSELVDVTTGKKIRRVGSVSSPMTVVGDTLYYTEYIPHPIFEQVNFSAIRAVDLKTNRSKLYHKWDSNFYLVKYRDGFASLTVDSLSNSAIRFFDSSMEAVGEYHFDEGLITLHSLAWDESTDMLCFIALTQEGMSIEALDGRGERVELLSPSAVSLSGMTASGEGVLYFSSIESGKNEIHSLDIVSGEQRRESLSRFGSQMPYMSGEKLLFTTYTPGGTMVAAMDKDNFVGESVEWSRLPKNILNPERAKWDVPIVDSIDIEVDSHSDDASSSAKNEQRYKAPFALNSWAPLGFDGDYIMASRSMTATYGITAFFQGSLSTLTGYATYGWLNESNWVKGRVDYKGLPVTLSLGAEYGGGDQTLLGGPTVLVIGSTPEVQDPYLSADFTVSLPLYLSEDGYSKLLQPSVSLYYTNTKIYNSDKSAYETGLGQYSASLWWSSTRYTSIRDITPRWGYALRGDVIGSFDSRVSTLYALYARGYLPGVVKNHSVTLSAGAQYQANADYNMGSKALYLTGVNDNYSTESYWAAMAQYSLPLFYPDWGWDGVVYFKRLSANLFGGYSYGMYNTTSVTEPLLGMENYTYGMDLMVDFNLLRSYSQSVTFTFAMPNNSFYFGMSYSTGF